MQLQSRLPVVLASCCVWKHSDQLSSHDIAAVRLYCTLLVKMEDFEYSVEICDRDWDCFFAECEECNLLPPSLAGVDDSGMSDIDDMGSILAARVQKVNPTAGFSEADRPIDGPPDCEGSPVEHYLSKHAVGGMESVLSGSEEDIHLQSVNIFFEKLKNLTEAERPAEPSQARDGKKRGREAIWENERCGDGQQASSTSLPKNIPKLNSQPASGETAVGNETAEPVDTISNINTVKKDVPGSNISPEPAASKLALKTNKSACPETRSFIREEACTETRVNEAARLNQSHDFVCSETATPHTDRAITVEMCAPLDDKREDSSTRTLSKKCSANSSSNQETVTHVKREEDPDVLQSDATRTNKPASQQSSPSASVKRKRRKKRRLSVEPAESAHGSERQVLVKQSDSEDEQRAWRVEFDTESFFYPLIAADHPTKDELVPIFSCSRSASRNLQYPEAYDHFFPSSSSSDESSDEEDGCGPVRVVTRFSHTSSASQISTDIYDNFFTDSDLRQNFFWKPTLSFRNMGLSRSTVKKQTLSNPLPVRKSGRSPGMTVHPIIALRNQDVRFPDPLLGLQPHRYEDLQMAVSNPRLDASLLPLRQSDMCLVCIAFASWVLKTANPQVGDTWKAVLLANVSALSAIRYLRKYVKMEAAASEKKLNYTASSDS
ncbi:nucleolar complex protein 2 homolog isoform X3 [Sebastes fasciatus]|uniref:nucleolar complex protein 2 homolog isoform X3 n=1 Tax=Sebastes fasciatus TaxID=394691 RepID=UPI003D9E7BCF